VTGEFTASSSRRSPTAHTLAFEPVERAPEIARLLAHHACDAAHGAGRRHPPRRSASVSTKGAAAGLALAEARRFGELTAGRGRGAPGIDRFLARAQSSAAAASRGRVRWLVDGYNVDPARRGPGAGRRR